MSDVQREFARIRHLQHREAERRMAETMVAAGYGGWRMVRDAPDRERDTEFLARNATDAAPIAELRAHLADLEIEADRVRQNIADLEAQR